jgi:dienelactone hydrolase
MKIWYVVALILVFAVTAQAEIRTEVVEYRQGDAVLEGYLAYDETIKGKRPGVLVVHEWWGLNSYIKRRTEELAKLGYVAFAADIYGKGVRATHADDAAALASGYRNNRQLLRARVTAGLEVLKNHKLTDPGRIGAIGYCFGGTTVIELALSGADIAGVVSFHGGLGGLDLVDAKHVKARVLVLHGADDRFVTADQMTAFQEVMKKAGIDWQMNYYGGAVHSFTNPEAGSDPSKGLAYHERSDRRSWDAMKTFFAEIFR